MISTAVQKGQFVCVYNERNQQILNLFGTLHGFTSATVSIKKGNFVYTINEKGQQISCVFSK